MSRTTVLSPAGYRRTPWKNGGGVTTDIAFDGEVWRFSRTPITTAGPFSDYTGYDRIQVLVAGRGLVLDTPDGEIDLRQPFQPVRFAGETPITSRLERGPVEVINLMGERSRVALDLVVLDTGLSRPLGPGIHIAYCPAGRAILRLAGETRELQSDRGLRIEDVAGMVACDAGPVVLGSIRCVSR